MSEKRHNGVIVLANGVFDVFHIGHLRHLQAARKMGDVLIVSVTEDEFVNKGAGRPRFQLKDRMDIIRSLAVVDDVLSCTSLLDAMQRVNPTIVVKGVEYRGRLQKTDKRHIKTHDIEVRFTYTALSSSTELIQHGFVSS